LRHATLAPGRPAWSDSIAARSHRQFATEHLHRSQRRVPNIRVRRKHERARRATRMVRRGREREHLLRHGNGEQQCCAPHCLIIISASGERREDTLL
jgi:hypothetical protein